MVELMPPARSSVFADPGREHGVAQDEKKKKVKCNYCGKVVIGGIYRLKQHLARVSREVTYCEMAPEEAYLRMKGNLEGCRYNKKARQSDGGGHICFNFHLNAVGEEEERISYRSKGKLFIETCNTGLNLTPLRSLGYVDPGWEHGVALDERKKKVKCNYCDKIVSEGINRFKQHLAKITGQVAPCKNAPEKVYLKIKDNMKWHRTRKRQKHPYDKEIRTFYVESNDEHEEQEEDYLILHRKSKEKLSIGDHWLGKDLTKTCREISSSSGSEPLLKKSRLDSLFLKGVSKATSLQTSKGENRVW